RRRRGGKKPNVSVTFTRLGSLCKCMPVTTGILYPQCRVQQAARMRSGICRALFRMPSQVVRRIYIAEFFIVPAVFCSAQQTRTIGGFIPEQAPAIIA